MFPTVFIGDFEIRTIYLSGNPIRPSSNPLTHKTVYNNVINEVQVSTPPIEFSVTSTTICEAHITWENHSPEDRTCYRCSSTYFSPQDRPRSFKRPLETLEIIKVVSFWTGRCFDWRSPSWNILAPLSTDILFVCNVMGCCFK